MPNMVRDFIYSTMSVFSRRYKLNSKYNMVALDVKGCHTFFGYYDKTPFSWDNRRVLGMRLGNEDGSVASIGCFDLDKRKDFQVIGKTDLWSWQLGARLQWYCENEPEIICYNKMIEGKYGVVFQSIISKKIVAKYSDPVFDISPHGRYAISLNFSRLSRLRPGYGYRRLPDSTANETHPENDGIVVLDLRKNTRNLIISLDRIANFHQHESMVGAEHYLNHLSFSPTGERFMLLHLWINKGKRFSRLLTSDIYGGNVYILEDKINMSHYAWKSPTEVLVHTAAKPFGTKYILYEDLTQNKKTIGEKSLVRSGHPSYSPDGKRLLVDTYPNRWRRQHLEVYTLNGEYIEKIGSFYCPTRFAGQEKCDLHPRWCRTGEFICIDSALSGRRAMYVIGLKQP